MSYQLALDSPIFIKYFIIVASLLVGSGIILFVLRLIIKDKIKKVLRIYYSWLVMYPLILGFIFGGRVFTIIGVTLISLLAFTEYAKATGLYRDWYLTIVVYIGIVANCVFTLMPDPRLTRDGWYGLYMTLPVYIITLILFMPIVKNKSKGQVQNVSLAIVGYIYIGWMFGFLGFFANSTNAYGYILFLMLCVALNDIFAFIFGNIFGKHKLRENISPNKTLEGSVFAFLFSMSLPWIFRFSFPHFQTIHLILAGIAIGIGGQVGDLIISYMKRDIGIKDMGSLIPGHGGILDRVDSLILTTPLFFHMVRWFHDIY